MANKTTWTLGGRKVNPRTLKAEFLEGFREEFLTDVAAVHQDLEDLIRRLNRRSSQRGVGFYAVRYNKPFEDAEVEVEEVNEGTFRIRVKNEGKGSPGYKFNLLDAGIPERTSTKPMLFPAYDGNLTKPGDNSFLLNRSNVKVEKPVRWIATKHVKGAQPRKFYESILKRGAAAHRGKRRPKEMPIEMWRLLDTRLGVTEFTIIED